MQDVDYERWRDKSTCCFVWMTWSDEDMRSNSLSSGFLLGDKTVLNKTALYFYPPCLIKLEEE